MIGKVTRKRMDGGSSFKRLIEYIDEAKKADWHMTSDNIVSLQTAAVEMKLVADLYTGHGDPVYHLIISWPEGEEPVPAQMEEAVRHTVKALGYEHHQFVASHHRDTGNSHVHAAINKVHPETFKAHQPRGDFLLIDRAMREIEIKQGWSHDRGPFAVEYLGDKPFVLESRDRRLLRQLSQGALALERYAGVGSFEQWLAAGQVDRVLDKCENWRQVHAALSLGGLSAELARDGKGLVIHHLDSGMRAKSGAIGDSYTLSGLESRLSQYQAPGVSDSDEAAAILDDLTERDATFTERDIDRYLEAYVAEDRCAAVKRTLLEHQDCVHLQTGDGTPRFSSRAVRQEEADCIQAAQAMREAGNGHPVDAKAIERAIASRTMRKEDQLPAFRGAIEGSGLALWIGRAGVGKSYVSKALRAVYQESGYKVVGLSFTNVVVNDMRGDGFDAHTVDAVLTRARKGKLRWDSKTILVVDELGMLPNRKLRELLMLARDRGCKLVGIGDDRQLPAVERGGMFGTLAKQFGANEINVIARQDATTNKRQNEAAGHFANYRFLEGLRIFHEDGLIKWSGSEEESAGALMRQWEADTTARGYEDVYIFSYTNARVELFNQKAQEIRRARGELGEDMEAATANGTRRFAIDDRIRITQTDRKLGVTNGARGVVTAVDRENSRISIQLADGEIRTLTLGTPKGRFGGIDLNYAGTVYKGQGQTIAKTLVDHTRHDANTSAYVAYTRQSQDIAVFAARETATDWRDIARQVSKDAQKLAAAEWLDAPRPYVATGDLVAAAAVNPLSWEDSERLYVHARQQAGAIWHEARDAAGGDDQFVYWQTVRDWAAHTLAAGGRLPRDAAADSGRLRGFAADLLMARGSTRAAAMQETDHIYTEEHARLTLGMPLAPVAGGNRFVMPVALGEPPARTVTASGAVGDGAPEARRESAAPHDSRAPTWEDIDSHYLQARGAAGELWYEIEASKIPVEDHPREAEFRYWQGLRNSLSGVMAEGGRVPPGTEHDLERLRGFAADVLVTRDRKRAEAVAEACLIIGLDGLRETLHMPPAAAAAPSSGIPSHFLTMPDGKPLSAGAAAAGQLLSRLKARYFTESKVRYDQERAVWLTALAALKAERIEAGTAMRGRQADAHAKAWSDKAIPIEDRRTQVAGLAKAHRAERQNLRAEFARKRDAEGPPPRKETWDEFLDRVAQSEPAAAEMRRAGQTPTVSLLPRQRAGMAAGERRAVELAAIQRIDLNGLLAGRGWKDRGSEASTLSRIWEHPSSGAQLVVQQAPAADGQLKGTRYFTPDNARANGNALNLIMDIDCATIGTAHDILRPLIGTAHRDIGRDLAAAARWQEQTTLDVTEARKRWDCASGDTEKTGVIERLGLDRDDLIRLKNDVRVDGNGNLLVANRTKGGLVGYELVTSDFAGHTRNSHRSLAIVSTGNGASGELKVCNDAAEMLAKAKRDGWPQGHTYVSTGGVPQGQQIEMLAQLAKQSPAMKITLTHGESRYHQLAAGKIALALAAARGWKPKGARFADTVARIEPEKLTAGQLTAYGIHLVVPPNGVTWTLAGGPKVSTQPKAAEQKDQIEGGREAGKQSPGLDAEAPAQTRQQQERLAAIRREIEEKRPPRGRRGR